MLECTIPEQWAQSKEYLNINGLEEVPIRGDGLCLLNSICECAYMDYNIPLTIGNLQKKIMEHLNTKSEKYLPWYDGTKESLISDVENLFQHRMYNTQGVDLIVSICTEVLKMNIRIFQEEQQTGHIKISHYRNIMSDEIINLKFSAKDKSSLGNHYDSICRIAPNENFIIGHLEDKLVTLPETHTETTNPNFPIDLTTSPLKDTIAHESSSVKFNILHETPIDLTVSPPPPSPLYPHLLYILQHLKHLI